MTDECQSLAHTAMSAKQGQVDYALWGVKRHAICLPYQSPQYPQQTTCLPGSCQGPLAPVFCSANTQHPEHLATWLVRVQSNHLPWTLADIAVHSELVSRLRQPLHVTNVLSKSLIILISAVVMTKRRVLLTVVDKVEAVHLHHLAAHAL